MSEQITEFTIDIPDADIEDLKRRLALTRWPDQIPGTGWRYGANTDYIRTLCDYWRDEYDWRKHEARLNSFPQFKTALAGMDIHFVHARSQHADATRLLISHGWPGTVVEFLHVIDPLVNPEAGHGGNIC